MNESNKIRVDLINALDSIGLQCVEIRRYKDAAGNYLGEYAEIVVKKFPLHLPEAENSDRL